MPENAEKTLQLLTAFVSGLSHKIRTPLSVVSNQLNYFKTMVPADECQRSLSRCKEIADILKEASLLLEGGFKLEPCTAKFFLNELRDQKEFSNLKVADGTKQLLLDMPSLKRGFRSLVDAIYQFAGGGGQEFLDSSLTIDLEENADSLQVTLGSKQISGFKNSGEDYRGLSLTEFICQLLDRDSYLAPLVEAVFLANGCRVTVSTSAGFSVSVEMPFLNG